MKIQDFIKERHYYCLKRKRNPMYFKVVCIHNVRTDVDVIIGARCIRQYEEKDIHDYIIMTRSGLFVINVTQNDLDNGRLREVSREEVMEAAMNMARYSLKEF